MAEGGRRPSERRAGAIAAALTPGRRRMLRLDIHFLCHERARGMVAPPVGAPNHLNVRLSSNR
eukprot:3447493-Prymnesium_polylepis.1